MNFKTYKVYGIFDDQDIVKYIGCTKHSLSTRLGSHLSEVKSFMHNHKNTPYFVFLSKYVMSGTRPEIHILESFDNPIDAGNCEYELIMETPYLINRTKNKHPIYQGYRKS